MGREWRWYPRGGENRCNANGAVARLRGDERCPSDNGSGARAARRAGGLLGVREEPSALLCRGRTAGAAALDFSLVYVCLVVRSGCRAGAGYEWLVWGVCVGVGS